MNIVTSINIVETWLKGRALTNTMQTPGNGAFINAMEIPKTRALINAVVYLDAGNHFPRRHFP